MKTLELVQVVTKEMKEKGHKINQDMTRDFLKALEGAVDGVIKNGDSVVALGVKFASKEQKGREGVITLGSKAGETYKTEDKIVPCAKYQPAKKAELTRQK